MLLCRAICHFWNYKQLGGCISKRNAAESLFQYDKKIACGMVRNH